MIESKQMIIRSLFILLFFVLSQANSLADIRMYLFPRVEINLNNEDDLAIADIARIDGDNTDLTKICNIKVKSELYSDGYIDRKELSNLLSSNVNDLFFIYGNAIRVIDKDKFIEERAEFAYNFIEEEILVRRGERVSLVVIKRGISVELTGRVMKDGKKGEEITVRMKPLTGRRSRLVKGIVRSRGLVEVVL